MSACLRIVGALGILNTRMLNELLLIKWIWRLYNCSKKDVCCQLLQAKYLKNRPFANSKCSQESQFWKGIHKVKQKFSWGAVFILNNDRNVRFLEDVWLGNVPLKLKYPEIYGKCRDKQATVSDCWDNGNWGFDFTRTFRFHDRGSWESLKLELQGVSLNDRRDMVHWALEK
ncbi:hypothetical protein PVAP13_4NG221821 [Panicum virgatum]|jgi:hypothetical protein|uniref:Reverse transcriptase zinc-binding domain-containing protein n=1 Tax=Panicum virgatum TaxID=38727 RepID=A0A8T0T6C2_PANVG|nr:hypothetical protein PVAP13_4NG221821 [Panicum virgatum]